MASQCQWVTEFNEQLSNNPELSGGKWNLKMVNHSLPERGWLITKSKGKAAFTCSHSKCANRWTSVNGLAKFNYRKDGDVRVFLARQKCQKCEDKFEDAIWEDSDIKRAVTKLLDKVKEKFYGSNNSTTGTPDNTYIPADMRAPHQSHLCEACELGECQNDDVNSITSGMEDLRVDSESSSESDNFEY
ncbi:uncharacterized protein LOC114518888 [Dendronephthya gigantea]|uniref:uncharacterized protein LOC114518888 n=1 Tax=Dendronephthya gigantea TaxID=151771 RepID=UPI00106A74CC|nr:uncharacterized protein LOC114518888 [Dendronephthya gigantea]